MKKYDTLEYPVEIEYSINKASAQMEEIEGFLTNIAKDSITIYKAEIIIAEKRIDLMPHLSSAQITEIVNSVDKEI